MNVVEALIGRAAVALRPAAGGLHDIEVRWIAAAKQSGMRRLGIQSQRLPAVAANAAEDLRRMGGADLLDPVVAGQAVLGLAGEGGDEDDRRSGGEGRHTVACESRRPTRTTPAASANAASSIGRGRRSSQRPRRVSSPSSKRQSPRPGTCADASIARQPAARGSCHDRCRTGAAPAEPGAASGRTTPIHRGSPRRSSSWSERKNHGAGASALRAMTDRAGRRAQARRARSTISEAPPARSMASSLAPDQARRGQAGRGLVLGGRGVGDPAVPAHPEEMPDEERRRPAASGRRRAIRRGEAPWLRPIAGRRRPNGRGPRPSERDLAQQVGPDQQGPTDRGVPAQPVAGEIQSQHDDEEPQPEQPVEAATGAVAAGEGDAQQVEARP